MGYRCPVCQDPQADDTHLANHLAFTALARGGDHEAWLEDNVPAWEGMGEADLAPEVAALADETDYPAVFEDTTDGERTQGRLTDLPEHGLEAPSGRSGARPDRATRAAIERARELTRERRDSGESPAEDEQ